MTEDAPECFKAKLEQLEALNQALQIKNLELRLRLQQRKSRWAFERQLLAIGGLGLLLLGLVLRAIAFSSGKGILPWPIHMSGATAIR